MQKIRLERHAFTSGQRQTQDTIVLPTIDVNFRLCRQGIQYTKPMVDFKFDSPAKQNAEAITSYLWDYLRKSGATGFYVLLGGERVSYTNAMLVYYLCQKIFTEIQDNNVEVLQNLRKIVKKKDFLPKNPQEICGYLLTTSYLPEKDYENCRKELTGNFSDKMGCNRLDIEFEGLMESFGEFCKENLGWEHKTHDNGGSWEEDAEINSLKDRIRMTLSYLVAQIGPFTTKNKDGWLINLSNGNAEDSIMGNGAKYGSSSGDIAPLGSLNKTHIQDILVWIQSQNKWDVVSKILEIKYESISSVEINKAIDPKSFSLSRKEMEVFFKFRADRFCGPFSMFDNLVEFWEDHNVDSLETKIDKFFDRYKVNRHKCNIGTPNVHCSTYSCDPKSRDVRPMFYGSFKHQLAKMRKVKEQVIMAKKSKQYVEQHLSSDRTKNVINSLYDDGKDETGNVDYFTIKESIGGNDLGYNYA